MDETEAAAPEKDTGRSGHRLLDIVGWEQLERYPKIGASWEGFIIENAIRALGAEERQCHFWATHAGPETFPLAQGIRAVSARRILEDLA